MKNRKSLQIIAYNIRSAYNVGSIFRIADGAGVAKIHLCGYSPTPENPKVAKTSLGAERTVAWEYSRNISPVLNQLKQAGVFLYGLERMPESKNIFSLKPVFPCALILGNEVTGISKKTIHLLDQMVEIPMVGFKKSLNVSTATGIAVYNLLFRS